MIKCQSPYGTLQCIGAGAASALFRRCIAELIFCIAAVVVIQ
jgi:hypothetical protein